MNVEERRAMIVRAALRLLEEEGPNVTTLQIARAAGISEPTIFRAFADKNEVLLACLDEVTKPENLAIELEAIALEAGLEDRLATLIDVVRAHSEKTGKVLNAIRLAAPSEPRRTGKHAEMIGQRWMKSYAAVHAGVQSVLKPDEDRLRLPVADMATLVLTIVFAMGRAGGLNAALPNVSTKQLADLILHGVMK